MAEPTLLDKIRASGLLSGEQIAELTRLPEATNPDPRALGRVLLQRQLLTRFQIKQVHTGKARDLRIGPYLLLDKLGEGGMGQVFKARHQHMNRLVALKLMRKEKLASPDSVSRFYREVEAAAQLQHPNIVLAFDAGKTGAVHYFSMEFVDGVDLGRLIKEQGPLPVARACDYVRQAALGLQHAHERGLIHRDIKPANLLLARENGKHTIKILDMGLARLNASTQNHTLTYDGQMLGTPDYLAPEQAIDARHATAAADIYSLGCTFYYLLTGQAPYQADSLASLLLKHQMEPVASLLDRCPEVPEELDELVRQMMAKDPDERPASAALVASALETFCSGEPVTAPLTLSTRSKKSVPASDDTWASLDGQQAKVVRPRGRGRSHDTAMERVPAKNGSRPGLYLGLLASGVLLIGVVIGLVVLALPQGSGSKARAEVVDSRNTDGEKPKLPEPGEEVPQEKQELENDGFVPLFNGKDLTGFYVESGDESHFRVQDGALVVTCPADKFQNYLLTRKEYGNCRIRLECWVEDGAQTGLAVRVMPGEKKRQLNGVTVPVHPHVKLSDQRTYSLALYWMDNGRHIHCPVMFTSFPLRTWNRVEMEVNGPRCQLWVNDVPLCDITADESEARNRPASWLRRARGPVDFHALVGISRLRNIEIKELPDD